MDDLNKTFVKETVEKFEQFAKDCYEDAMKAYKSHIKINQLKWNKNKLREKFMKSIEEQCQNCLDADKTIEDLRKTESIHCLMRLLTILSLFLCIFIFLHIRSVDLEKTQIVKKIQVALKVFEESSITSKDLCSVQIGNCSFKNQQIGFDLFYCQQHINH